MRLLLALVALVGLYAAPAAAQTPGRLVPSAEMVRRGGTDWPAYFQGSLTYTLAESYDGDDPHTPWCQQGEETVTAQLRLDLTGTDALGERMKYVASEGSWTVSGGCHGVHSWVAFDPQLNQNVDCSWTVDEDYSGSGSFPDENENGLESSAILYLGRDTDEATLFYLVAGQASVSNNVRCSAAWPGGQGDSQWTDSGDQLFTTGFGDDQLARGTHTGDGGEMRVVLSGQSEATQSVGGVYTITTTRTWSGGLGPRALELVFEPLDYDTWTPSAGRDEATPGGQVAVRARLQYDDGGPADIEAEGFTFELVGTSREPGVAINWPLMHPADTPDLQFAPERNAGQHITAEGQRLETLDGGTEWTATVSAYDWGAWGEVRVSADMGNGWTLTGRLLSDRTQESARLPKRQPGSHVADAWLARTNVAGRRDDSDDEGHPSGDGHSGDGLALYEEYRGFIENGAHRTADPWRKDLFVFDEVGGLSKQAISMFAAGTGLAVHHQFAPAEYDPHVRLVNPNAGAGGHLGDQHGVRIVSVGGDRTAAEAVSEVLGSDIGTPGGVRYVAIPQAYLPGGAVWNTDPARIGPYMVSTIAHELGHSVNIRHHGETDRLGVPWRIATNAFGGYARDDDGELQIVETGDAGNRFVRLFDEAGARHVPRDLREKGHMTVPQMGVPNGQHSGDERCFMRYDNATAALSATVPDVRYVDFHETTGTRLCGRRDGTGVNASGRQPQPRYDDATLGACVHQICVNDRHHP